MTQKRREPIELKPFVSGTLTPKSEVCKHKASCLVKKATDDQKVGFRPIREGE
jgi:hypothetical protein